MLNVKRHFPWYQMSQHILFLTTIELFLCLYLFLLFYFHGIYVEGRHSSQSHSVTWTFYLGLLLRFLFSSQSVIFCFNVFDVEGKCSPQSCIALRFLFLLQSLWCEFDVFGFELKCIYHAICDMNDLFNSYWAFYVCHILMLSKFDVIGV